MKVIAIYVLTIVVTTFLCIQIGAEIITQYSMQANGYTDIERHLLADDMGFGMLLMFGLVPELIMGVIGGVVLGKKLNGKFKNT